MHLGYRVDPPSATGRSGALRAVCAEIHAALERSVRELSEEIRGYPTPIPRCDAQFNHLYARRACVAAELERARAALAEAGDDACAVFVQAFAQGGDGEETAAEARLRAQVRAQLGALTQSSGEVASGR